MRGFYPRKQTLFIFIICVIIVAGIAIYTKRDQIQNNAALGVSTVAEKQYDYNISPTDGSDTWQNQFTATSSTSDAVKYKANPISNNTTQQTPTTLTDQLGQGLFKEYWGAHQANLDSDPQVMQSIIDRYTSSVSDTNTNSSYSISDLKITNNYTPETLTIYAHDTFSAMNNMPQEDAATVAKQALDTGNVEELSRLDPLIASYMLVLKSLLQESVPQPIAQHHLDLVNGVSILLNSARALRNTSVDPVKSLAVMKDYLSGYENISSAVSDINNYYSSQGISLRSYND